MVGTVIAINEEATISEDRDQSDSGNESTGNTAHIENEAVTKSEDSELTFLRANELTKTETDFSNYIWH